MTQKSEKIRVLVDTDGDGVADKQEIFSEKFNDLLDGTAAGIMAFEGKIYFACIPKVWMLSDDDGDLKADEHRVIQDGFGVRVSFSGHDLNGFALGPDGRLYTTIGDRGFSFTTREGREYKFPNQGAILRFEPDGSNMEVVHTGLRNPKEIAFDQFGTGITVDNNSDQGDRARVVFMLEGADSGWRMGHQVLHSFHKTAGIPDRPINQWMQEKMWEPKNDAQPGHIVPPMLNLTSGPSGLAYYPGTGFKLGGIENQFLICDYRGGAAASGISASKMTVPDSPSTNPASSTGASLQQTSNGDTTASSTSQTSSPVGSPMMPAAFTPWPRNNPEKVSRRFSPTPTSKRHPSWTLPISSPTPTNGFASAPNSTLPTAPSPSPSLPVPPTSRLILLSASTASGDSE